MPYTKPTKVWFHKDDERFYDQDPLPEGQSHFLIVPLPKDPTSRDTFVDHVENIFSDDSYFPSRKAGATNGR